MITSIRTLLKDCGIEQEKSVYCNMQQDILDFPLTIGDFVTRVPAKSITEQSGSLTYFTRRMGEILDNHEEYARCEAELDQIRESIREDKIKSRGGEKDQASDLYERRIKLKERKKAVVERLEAISDAERKKFADKLGYDAGHMEGLCYKSTVYFTWLQDLRLRLPVFEKVALTEMEHIPFFVSGMEFLELALSEQQDIGMVGGPCLFGLDEVLLHIHMKDGQKVSFDSSCGRRCLNEKKTEATLEEYITEFNDDIENIEIENRKNGVTRQEYDSILYLFEMASVLNAKVVVPLPDMSYFKYAKSDLKGLTDEKREEVLAVFRKECYRITDIYLDIILDIAGKYPNVEYKVMHDRNTELRELFYEKRAPFISNSSYIQKITNVDGKKDAVIDYITMLALPYYYFGTRHVVQLDSIDETDSGRKCRKIHKGDIWYTQILYPERLSRDGQSTIYYAPYEYKDYIVGGKHEA